MYQALYRKWRPRTFDDVVGQEHITRTLKNEVAAGRQSHAYLFCGTRGTGKTSCSKILAKAVNCLDPRDGNPCNECEACRGIDNDSALDVIEIDAASNSGVDNIRDLREKAHLTPAAAKLKVYIIDETHMLSQGAFNALLKIMEEPPPHVLFILATTELHKVPATILSRCQRFDFRRIPSEIIASRLLDIAGKEEIVLEEEAAALIARLADGGMRDALSLLDLCLSRGETHISAKAVSDCAGLVGQDHLFAIGQAAAGGDNGAVFSILEELWAKSADSQRLCEQLIGFYRNLMVAKTVPKPGELIQCLPEELERYVSLAGELELPRILAAMNLLQDTLARMSRTAMRRTELEIGLVKLCRPELDASPQVLLARLEKLERTLKAGGMPRHAPEQAAVPPAAKTVRDTPPSREELSRTEVAPFAQWDDVLEALKTKNMALFGALAHSKAYTGGGLLLVDTGEDSVFASMVRSDSYAKESLREAVLAVTGQKFRLGPYNEKKYQVKQEENKLDFLLTKASELGVDVQVK